LKLLEEKNIYYESFEKPLILLSSPIIPARDVNAIFEQRPVYRKLFCSFLLASNSSQMITWVLARGLLP
jgi:hypothetical protein